MYLFFDTETNGLPIDPKLSHVFVDNWPRLVSVAWVLKDINKNTIEEKSFIIKPDGWTIPENLTKDFHGISTEMAEKEGTPIEEVLEAFVEALNKTTYVVGHNIRFDRKILAAEMYRNCFGKHYDELLYGTRYRDTMHVSRVYVEARSKKGGIKFPNLQEMYTKLFEKEFSNAHTALGDLNATMESFYKLFDMGLVEEYYKTHRDISENLNFSK